MQNTQKILLLFILILGSCRGADEKSSISLSHFNHLYDEVELNGKEAGILHIYSEYPDYRFEIEPNEGYTCVDDIARAMVFLGEYLQKKNDKAAGRQLQRMAEFVLQMQNKNGYFNNFLWEDGSINTTYRTCVAEPNWWSWRALWALEKVLPLLQKNNPQLAGRAEQSVAELIQNIKNDIPNDSQQTDTIEGIIVPVNLPYQYSSDQAAVLILGLIPYFKRTNDTDIEKLIHQLAKGIMKMQKGDATTFPYGAFLSWQNLWHAWGNNQAYALLKAGKILNKQEYIRSALKEIDHFYPFMIENKFLSSFKIADNSNVFKIIEKEKYPQIAYGMRPMIWASLEAYTLTENKKYLNTAQQIWTWFEGKNIANTAMFDSHSGRCFDGIISILEVNKNAGAESTVEALLALVKMQQYKE